MTQLTKVHSCKKSEARGARAGQHKWQEKLIDGRWDKTCVWCGKHYGEVYDSMHAERLSRRVFTRRMGDCPVRTRLLNGTVRTDHKWDYYWDGSFSPVLYDGSVKYYAKRGTRCVRCGGTRTHNRKR